MTESTEDRYRPLDPDQPSADFQALRTSAREARARAVELRLRLDSRRRRYRELTGRGGRGATGPTATEIAGLRSRAEEAEDRADNLERALASNRRIGMAVGILLARLHCTEEEAFEILRRESMRQNVRLAQIAEQVVYTGTV